MTFETYENDFIFQKIDNCPSAVSIVRCRRREHRGQRNSTQQVAAEVAQEEHLHRPTGL